MDFQAIFKNVKEIGVTGTFSLALTREKKRRKDKKLDSMCRRILKKINAGNSLQDCEQNIQKYLKYKNDGNIDFSSEEYQDQLKIFLEKNILKSLYEEYSDLPIEDTSVFVWPSNIDHQGIEAVYDKTYDFLGQHVLLHELNAEHETLPYYDDIIEFIKELALARKIYIYGANEFRYIQFRDETDVYKTKSIKCICIKSIYPDIYTKYSQYPIQNKVLFLQPRAGLNQSFRYIYHVIEKEQLYEPILYELHRGEGEGYEYYCNAIDFVKDMATSKAVFEHESNDLLGYINIRPETQIIQLWHGCGVFKKIGLDTYGKPGYKTMEEYNEYPEYNKYSCVTIASPELSWVFEQFMGISKESGIIQPIGISRTDEFFSEEYIQNCYKKLYEKIPQAKEKKVILYAPTYRGLGQNRVSPDQLDVKKFADALFEDYILIFKHHQTAIEVPEIPEEYKDDFAYDMTRGKGMDINELMTIADICISDYSSLVFEYSLFERPMLFYVYDLEQYIDDRGLYYDFDEITPGPLCKTNEEMIDYIQHIDERFDKQVVTDFKNRFMCSCDGHSTDRILDLIQ